MDLIETYIEDSNLINSCRDLFKKLGIPLVHYEERSGNIVADMLAKEGSKLGSYCFWKEWIVPPLFVRKQLRTDISINVCIHSNRPKHSPAYTGLPVMYYDST
ncbi:hypothetical protein FXO38_32021, partial [Capsicum annuum]